MKKAVIFTLALLSFGIAKAQNEINNDVHYQVIHFSNDQLILQDTTVNQNNYSVDEYLADLEIKSENLNLIQLDGSMQSEAVDQVWVLPNNSKSCLKIVQECHTDSHHSGDADVTIKKMSDPNGTEHNEDIQIIQIEGDGKEMSQQEIELMLKEQGIELPEGNDSQMIVKTMIIEHSEEYEYSEDSKDGQNQEEEVDIQITKLIDENGQEQTTILINGEEATQEELDAFNLLNDIEVFELDGNANEMTFDSHLGNFEHTVVVVSPVHYLEKSDKSVEQSSLLEGLNFSPNPNNGQFQVNFELKQKGKTKIEIRNIQGQLVYEEDLGKIKGKYSNFIDISNEGAGTYILSVLQGKQRIAERIIVQ